MSLPHKILLLFLYELYICFVYRGKTKFQQEEVPYQIHGFSLVLGEVRGNKVSSSGSAYPGLDRGDGCK